MKEDLPKHLFPFADGYLLVFSVTDEASFQVVDVIRKEVESLKEAKKDLVIVVLGKYQIIFDYFLWLVHIFKMLRIVSYFF